MTVKSVASAMLEPRSRFNSAFQATETFNYLDGSKYYTWTAVRRQNIDKLVSSIIRITVFITAAQAFGGQASYPPYTRGVTDSTDPSKYGIAYQLGAVAWWAMSLMITVFVAILWFPLFKWVNLSTSSKLTTEQIIGEDGLSHTVTKSPIDGVMHFLRMINKYVYTGLAYFTIFEFLYHLYTTVKHVDALSVRSSSSSSRATDVRRVRLARLGLASGMLMGVGLGAPTMIFWRWMDLVHVTKQEYALIIVPIQLTMGIALASVVQVACEKKTDLSKEEQLFEKDNRDEFTLEGMRKALNFIANSKVEMRTLLDLATGKDENRTEEGKFGKGGQNADDKHIKSPLGDFNEKAPLV